MQLAPAFVEPPPVAAAAVQQHDRGRGPGSVGQPQVTLQRLRTRAQRTFEFDEATAACSAAGAQRSHRRSRIRSAASRTATILAKFVMDHLAAVPPMILLQIPKIFRALAFNTFGRISSRMSSLAKSASQRSGVITGQSEPNSILSCRIELM